MEKRKKQEEEEEIARLRKDVVHKAQPIKKFKPVVVKQGTQPVTIPMTPEFHTDNRYGMNLDHS